MTSLQLLIKLFKHTHTRVLCICTHIYRVLQIC